MMSLQEECDGIKRAIECDDVSSIQQLLSENVDVIDAKISCLFGVSIVKHNV